MSDYDIWFSRVNISLKDKSYLLDKFKFAEDIYENTIYKKENNVVSEKCYSELVKAWNKDAIEKIQTVMKDKNIKCVKYYEDHYPAKLKNINNYPYMLYFLGDISKLNNVKCVSIVGSRNATQYGMNAASLISEKLSSYGLGIVSGMARGIDSCAHYKCIDKKSYTCAVLGCGIDIVYPKSNKTLYDSIIDNGCIVSEFPPLTPPYSYNFPIRNRIISGLSELIIVVEAGIRSGTLITATYALEQGKDVLAVPGSIFSDKSKGTNKLIRDGAFPFTDFTDLEMLLGIELIDEKTDDDNCLLNKMEKKLLSLLSSSPLHIDDLCRMVSIDINQLYDVLFEMQFKKVVRCINGNYYIKIETRI